MNVTEWIEYETRRQSGTAAEADGMYDAWIRAVACEQITAAELCRWDALIKCEPSVGYRLTPVTFANGGYAVDHMSIPTAMDALLKAINDDSEFPGVFANEITREFLVIHPFRDGNGRVGSLMYNWLKGTLHDPEPMPYYFGEDHV